MTDAPDAVDAGRRRRGLTAENKVALLNVAVLVVTLAALPIALRLPGPTDDPWMPWWAVAILVGIGESAVVHFRFRRDSYSFSLSEIPLVIGLYLASPVQLLVGQTIGNLAAFLLRRNRGVKLAFNVISFTAQAVVAIIIFRALAQFGDAYGGWGWAGVFLGTLAALLVSDLLVTQAISLTGGRLSRAELNDVLLFSLVASTMNSGLGLIAVIIIQANPSAAWLGALPPVVLLIAYRAYTTQRDERARAEALYEAVLGLHAAPVIEDALDVVTLGATRMFDSEHAVVFIIPEWGGRFAYRTVANLDRVVSQMRPAPFDPTSEPWAAVLAGEDGRIISGDEAAALRLPDIGEITHAMVTPITTDGRLTGALIVANPTGSSTSYDLRDLQTFATIGRHLATSLENGRLEDHLTEVIRLKERLEELVRSKDQFIASVSHELRTPLTGIVGLAQELRENRAGFGPAEVDEFLSLIYEQSAELGNIIEDLLVAARADIGTLVVKPTPTRLVGELEPVLATHAQKAESKVIHTTVRGVDALAMVDPLRFRQIMRNLITNAVRYGGDNVWVEIAEQNDATLVSVVDDGSGVSERSVEEIFEAYGRADSGAANPTSVGLGLAVSRQLARLMGGDLVYRRAGGHTRFELVLPRAPGLVRAAS